MTEEHVREVLERYLAGECTSAERERVEAWMQAEPSRRAYVDSLRTLGEAWAGARPQFDSRAAWQQVATRAGTAHPGPQWGTALHASSRRATTRRWMGAGALAAAVLGAVVVGTRTWPAETQAPAPREYATAAGQQMALTLPDGTRLRLAPQSRLTVDGDYGRGTRTVHLAGQAYFEVTHDDARPFRVRAGNTVAWDLGTKFTVRAYAGENVRLAVEEGSVAIPQALAAPLLPGDVAVVDSAGRGTVEHGADLGPYTVWTQGTLEFQDTPLREAAADLSRWFGVEVRLGDPELAHRRITVAVAESSVTAALDLIAPAVGARYERRGGAVMLYSLQTP